MGRLFGKFIGAGFLIETPSGNVDGSNAAFTLANTPASSGGTLVHLDGLLQAPGGDYTLSGSTITFATAPSVGQSVVVHYLKQT